jgi:halimadienyl-diphosphate synthase
MDLRRGLRCLLQQIGPNIITRSSYDTAWVARLGELDASLSMQALEWLREHQAADGSWGTNGVRYHHERVVCTLAAMTALARWGRARDRLRLERAKLALETMIDGLPADPAGATVGFEMIVPTLLAEAQALGLIQRLGDGLLERLTRYRAAKLAALPEGVINRYVTVAFSAEMVGPDGLHLLDVENLHAPNGSVAYSPAATAFVTMHVRNQNASALKYLRSVAVDGAVPYVTPIEIFERTWPLWNLALAGPLDDDVLALCQPHLDLLEAEWKPGRGIAASAGLALLDGDDTSLTYDVLRRFGRPVDLQGVLHYEQGNHFRCYGIEANPSISTNIHALGALRQAGLGVAHPSVAKLLRFLRQVQTGRLFWFDKWHASPYYPTSHAVIACAGYADWLAKDAVAWILGTQNPDGSWGFYGPTAEETAYCLQALVIWKRNGGQVPGDVLKRGTAWLADHADPPYPSLWIGKCLYHPLLVVRSAILSALTLVAQK